MPLSSGSGQNVISSNIKEMMDSPTFAKGKSRAKKQQMAVAAAESKARGGKKRSLVKDAMGK